MYSNPIHILDYLKSYCAQIKNLSSLPSKVPLYVRYYKNVPIKYLNFAWETHKVFIILNNEKSITFTEKTYNFAQWCSKNA